MSEKERLYHIVKTPAATGGKIKILVKYGKSPWRQSAALYWVNGFEGLTEKDQTEFAERIVTNLQQHQYKQL